MERMKLSIIVPVYNSEDYIEQCVQSLVEQQVEDKEIILVNDGSTDSSESVMRALEEKYPGIIRVISTENRGQGAARNSALDVARGEYIGFVDSDDYIRPEMYRLMIEAAEKEHTDMAVCDICMLYENGEEGVFRNNTASEEPLDHIGSVCCRLFRRDYIAQLRFPTGVWYEDLYFSVMLAVKGSPTAAVDKALYCYRVGHSSTMHNKNAKKNLDILKVIDALKPELSRQQYEYLVINHILLDAVNRVAEQKSSDGAEVISQLLAYVHGAVPQLSVCEGYQKTGFSRRLIMSLNYKGLYGISQTVFKLKKLL